MKNAVYVAVPEDPIEAQIFTEMAIDHVRALKYQNPVFFFEEEGSKDKPVLKLLKRLDKSHQFELILLWIGNDQPASEFQEGE